MLRYSPLYPANTTIYYCLCNQLLPPVGDKGKVSSFSCPAVSPQPWNILLLKWESSFDLCFSKCCRQMKIILICSVNIFNCEVKQGKYTLGLTKQVPKSFVVAFTFPNFINTLYVKLRKRLPYFDIARLLLLSNLTIPALYLMIAKRLNCKSLWLVRAMGLLPIKSCLYSAKWTYSSLESNTANEGHQ